MFGGERSRNQRKEVFESAKRPENTPRPATNNPAFCGGGGEIIQLWFAKIRHDGNDANFLPGIVGVNSLLDGRIADDTTTRSINQVTRNPDLKGPKPKRALCRPAGGVEFMEHGHPSAAQLLSQLFREPSQREWNAAPLITIIRIVENDVLVSPSQHSRVGVIQA